jgi:hypothetical protein
VNEASDAMQNYVNKGIGNHELDNAYDFEDNALDPYEKKGWLKNKQIYRPEFYGSPSPRMMAVSGQSHYRETNNDWSTGAIFNVDMVGESKVGVPGACTRIKLRHKATVNVMCSFYMFEFGGVALAASENNRSRTALTLYQPTIILDPESEEQASRGYESLRAGRVFIQVNGNSFGSTKRYIYTSAVGPKNVHSQQLGQNLSYAQRGFIFLPMVGRHQHSIMVQLRLDAGVHDIGLVFEPNRPPEQEYRILDRYFSTDSAADEYRNSNPDAAPSFPKSKHIFFLARNLVVDCYYEKNTPR